MPPLPDPLTLTAALILGTLAVGRAVRLVTHDAYPPMQWVRDRFTTWAVRTPARRAWLPLVTCPFCFAPYAAAVNLAWAALGGLQWGSVSGTAWWLVNVWAAVSYAAAMVVVRDQPED